MTDDRDYEALAVKLDAAEARIAHLENHIEAVAKDTHKIMVAYEVKLAKVEAYSDKWYKRAMEMVAERNDARDALPAAYQLGLADTYLSRDVLPDPTAAELMARINEGDKK